MKDINILFLASVFFVHFIACNTHQKKIAESNINLEKRETLILPLKYIEPVLFIRYFKIDTTEFFISLEDVSEIQKLLINRYNLNSKKIDTLLNCDLPFKSELETITDFHYNPEIDDTIYLYSGYNIYAKHLYNEGMRVIEINSITKSVYEGYLKDKFFYSTNEIFQELILLKDSHFLFKVNNIQINYKDPKQYLEHVFTSIDKYTRQRKLFENTRYLKNYQQGNLYGLGSNINPFGVFDNKHYFYYGFAKSHNIYRLNTITGKIEEKEIKSKHIGDGWKSMNEDDAFLIDKINTYNITEPKYFKLLYDSVNNVIYRFCYHALALKNKDGLFNTLRDKPFSIQIIDATNLTIINEVVFDGHAYIPEHAFIDKYGFLNMTINNYKIGDTSHSYVIQKFELQGL